MKIKIKYSLLALLMVISTIVGTLSIANPAFASGPPANPEEEAKSYLYYKALASCFEQSGTGSVATADGTAGHWFRGGGAANAKSTVMGYMGDPGNGTASCDDTNMINSAMSLWGLGSGIDAWCNVMQYAGPFRDGGANRDCAKGDGPNLATVGGNNRADSFKQVIEEKYYGARGEPQLSSEAKYFLYLSTFTKLCQAKQVVMSDPAPTPPLTADQTNIPNTDKGYKVRVVNAKGVVEEWIYQGTGDAVKTSPINMFDDNGQGGGTPSCNDLATRIGENADAYATYKVKNPDAAIPDQGATGFTGSPADAKTSCVIDGIGWIICPVVTFMSKIVDAAYTIVASLLTVAPLSTDTSSTIYKTWDAMRNIANVAFVIAFLIIVFSQLTSVGITNYGVKKMLPRLVAAAILVNISYWICSISVDLSNILGGSINQIFHTISQQVIPSQGYASDAATGDAGWEKIVGPLLAGTLVAVTFLFVSLSALVPALIVALLAIVTVFVVLTVRQALIILLIVISPLAFVAFLLPNTESLFKKWYELFKTMLLMFPIIAMLFGASALASTIVSQTAKGPNEGITVAIQIMGALIAIVPLALTPIVMKAAGGVLNKVGGFVNNPNKGPFDRMKKGAEGFAKDRKNVRKIRSLNNTGPWYRKMPGRGAATRYGARRSAASAGLEAEVKRSSSRHVAETAASNENFRNTLAGGTNGWFGQAASTPAIERALANAKFTIRSAEAEEVKAASVTVEGLDAAGLANNIESDNTSGAIKAASLERLIKIGDPKDYQTYVDQYGSDDSEESMVVRNSIANALQENGPKSLRASDIDTIRNGQMGAAQRNQDGSAKTDDGTPTGNPLHNASSMGDMAKASVGAQRYTQEKMASDTADNMAYAWANADAAGKATMVTTANALKANETLRGKISNPGAVDRVISQAAAAGIVGNTPNTPPSGQPTTQITPPTTPLGP